MSTVRSFCRGLVLAGLVLTALLAPADVAAAAPEGALGLITNMAGSAPYEDLKLKGQ